MTADRDDSNAPQCKAPSSINPDAYPLTKVDRLGLQDRHGLTDNTVDWCRFGSISDQHQLDALGIPLIFDDLPSRIVVPYLATADEHGCCRFRLFKRTLPGTGLPLYLLSRSMAKGIMLVENELNAAAAWQLGYTGVGLTSTHRPSLPKELIDTLRILEPSGRFSVHLGTERRRGGRASGTRIAALAYSCLLEEHFGSCPIVDLPDEFLNAGYDSKERPVRRADLGGALADGLTTEAWDECVQRALDFWNAEDGPDVKIRAIVHAFGEKAFQRGEDLERLLKDQPPTVRAVSLEAFCRGIRSAAFDRQARTYDDTKLAALVAPTRQLFLKFMPNLSIVEVRRLIQKSKHGVQRSHQGPPSLADRAIVIRENAAYKSTAQGPRGFITNAVPTNIVTGKVQYLTGSAIPRHVVTLRGRNEPIEVLGSLWQPGNWQVDPQNDVTIARPADFKSLLHHAIEVDGIRSFDNSATKTLWVGTYLDSDGRLAWQDGVCFPQSANACPYADTRFADGGDKDVLRMLADLYRDQTVALWLVWDLGSAFKPVFKYAYPHASIIGNTGTGKSTIADRMAQRLNRRRFSTGVQWKKQYRTKLTLSNTNVSVVMDEVQRLEPKYRPMALEVLNSAYNVQFSTHGANGMSYVLGTPAALMGQDFPFEDIALEAKIVRITLHESSRDPKALTRLDATTTHAPYRAWLKFACDYAHQADVRSEVDAEVRWLRQELAQCNFLETSNTARSYENYAFVLFSAKALAEFGVKLDIRSRVASLLRDHLDMRSSSLTGRDRESIGVQFVQDVVLALQTPRTRRAFPWLVVKGDLFVSVSKAMEHLGKGKGYDGLTADGMARQLKDIGADFVDNHGKPHRPVIYAVQTRCVRIPAAVLESLHCSVRGLDPSGEGGG